MQLREVRQRIGLLERRINKERQEVENAEAQMNQYAEQIKQLQNKIQANKKGADVVRCRIAGASSAPDVGHSQQNCLSGISCLPENETNITDSTAGPTGGACLPPPAATQQPSEGGQRIADLTQKLNDLSAEAAILRKAAADLEKHCKNRKKTQKTSETKRKKALHPARVNTAALQRQHQAELHELCAHWGLQAPSSDKARASLFSKIMERVTEQVPAMGTPPSAAGGSIASTSQGVLGASDATRLQFRPEILQEKSGTLKAFMLLNAYIHPVQMDLSIQEEALSIALGVAKRFDNTHSLQDNELSAAETISECAEIGIAIIQSQLAACQQELESARNQTFRFLGAMLREKPRAALAQHYRQLGNLAVRHHEDLLRDMKTMSADLLAKQMDIGDLQALLRIRTDVDVLTLTADLLANQVRQDCIQRERNALAEELAVLRKEHLTIAANTSISNGSVIPDTMPESSFVPGTGTMLEWETKLSISVGKLQHLEEGLVASEEAHRRAENRYRHANGIIGDTQQSLDEQRGFLEQLQQQEAKRSAAFRELFTQRNLLRENINAETEHIKRNPALTKLISETALGLVLARHINQSDHALIDRSFVVGRSGTYASFRVFLRALVAVHQDATERFADLMYAPSIADFDAARQKREAGGKKMRDVKYQHAESVGWAFHADGPHRDTRRPSTISTYSIDWYGISGPLIAHIYPSAGDP